MRRLSALLLGCWLSLLSADLPSLHACTMHAAGGHGATATTRVAPRTDGAVDHGTHAGHGPVVASANALGVADAETDIPQHSEDCRCLGECCTSTVAPLAPDFDRPRVLARPSGELVPGSRDAAPRRASDLRLPFSNGPPGHLTA